MKKRILCIAGAIFILLLISLAVTFFYTHSDAESLEEFVTFGAFAQKDLVAEITVEEGILYSNSSNIKFRIPYGWEVAPLTTELPKEASNAEFILQKRGSGCRAGDVESLELASYTQLAFAEDGNWWVHKSTQTNAQQREVTYERDYLPGEIRVSKHLVLWDVSGKAPSDDCNSDLDTMLGTTETYFKSIELTMESKGTLYIENHHDDDTGRGTNVYFLFNPENTKDNFLVKELPRGADFSGRIYVVGTKLYYLNHEYNDSQMFTSEIRVLDPFAGTDEVVTGTNRPDTYISSLYMHNDKTLFYTMGPSSLSLCLDGYGECTSDFYSSPVEGGMQSLVQKSTPAGFILGYNAAESAFYFIKGWGDAGCSSFSAVRLDTAGLNSLGKYGSCGEEPARTNAETFYNSLLKKVGDTGKKVSVVGIHNGALTAEGGVSQDSSYASYFFMSK
ncbi:MAG: hypothetical protein AB202_01610 [Parcubacteria bacterium C7867-007]|nr:MAG: hypothetical protein AB202_01610 [Parcubacteria bacterium C7867-007]